MLRKIIILTVLLIILPYPVFPRQRDRKRDKSVIAVVNGQKVKKKEYGEYIFDNANTYMLLENYLSTLLFKKKAEELGLVITGEDIERVLDERVNEQLSRWKKNEEAYNNLLKSREITEKEFIKDLQDNNRREVTSDLYASRIIYRSKGVSEVEIKSRFNEKYGRDGRKYKLKHIIKSIKPKYLSKTSESYDYAIRVAEEAARKKIERLLVRLSEEGADSFGKIAEEESEDIISKNYRGNIGRFIEGIYKEDFDRIVPTLDEGEISGILKSSKGFHIVRVDRKDEDGMDISHIQAVVSYGYVKDTRSWNAGREKFTKALDGLKDKLKQGTDFEELAEEESDDYSSVYGCDISGRWRDSYGYEFGNALENLKKGDVSIVESPKGINLVLVEDIIVTGYTDELKEKLRDEIRTGVASTSEIVKLAVELLKEAEAYYKL